MDAEDEEVVRRLRTKGYELHWVLETRLGEFQRDGWKPVTQWDKTGRRSIFMDCISVLPRIRKPCSNSGNRRNVLSEKALGGDGDTAKGESNGPADEGGRRSAGTLR